MDSTQTLDLLTTSTANNETRVNELGDALSPAGIFGRRASTTTGLTWGYYGGRWGGISVAHGTVTLTTSTTNYVVAERATGVVSAATSTTNWNNVGAYARLYKITAGGSTVTAYEDHRAGQWGPLNSRQIRAVKSASAAYTLVAADADATILHPSADTTARTFTIPSNSSVGYPVGTELEIVNQNAAGALTITSATDTMRLVPGGTTGSRTLAANGFAIAKKIATTEWIIYGWGLT